MNFEVIVKRNLIGHLMIRFVPTYQKSLLQALQNARGVMYALAAEDTSAMKESIYIHSAIYNDYGERAADAEGLKPDVVILPEVPPNDSVGASIGVAAQHGIFIENGHHTSGGGWVDARPFFWPGLQEFFPDLEKIAQGDFLDMMEGA